MQSCIRPILGMINYNGPDGLRYLQTNTYQTHGF